MRIATATVLLIDLFIRSLSIKAFFTDEGVLPIHILKQYCWSSGYFSLYALSGELCWQITLFSLNAIVIILLLIGYKTRLVTIICWLFLVSLQTRNPYISQSGDDLLRLLLFWGIFLPWGERYSIKKQSHYPNTYFSIQNIAYLLLPCSVLFFSAMLKTSSEWHQDGTALYYALSLDQIRLPLGTLIYPYPKLLSLLTHVVYYIEVIAPILILLPFVSINIRLVGMLFTLILFIGIGSTLYVGLFYIIVIASLIGMLPEQCMNAFETKWYQNKTTFINKTNYTISTAQTVYHYFERFFVICLSSFCLVMNLSNINSFPFIIHENVIRTFTVLRLEQNWSMFAPSILKDDGWFVYSALTKDHKYIDIKHNGKPVSYQKPKIVVTEFESDRWRKFQEFYTFKNNNHMRPYYCNYLLNKWNREHPKNQIIDLAIFFMKETSLANYQVKPIEKNTVCYCTSQASSNEHP